MGRSKVDFGLVELAGVLIIAAVVSPLVISCGESDSGPGCTAWAGSTKRIRNLQEIGRGLPTDKGTIHSYLPVYDHLFYGKRFSARRVLEIGIDQGGSMMIWREYFPWAAVHGLDIKFPKGFESARRDPRYVFTIGNAYLPNVTAEFRARGWAFDVMIDDGPHTIGSMLKFIELYLPLLKEDGVLVIEDVQRIDWVDRLRASLWEADQKVLEVVDLRTGRNQYDDILFVVNRQSYGG